MTLCIDYENAVQYFVCVLRVFRTTYIEHYGMCPAELSHKIKALKCKPLAETRVLTREGFHVGQSKVEEEYLAHARTDCAKHEARVARKYAHVSYC